jgi:methyl-accepting chemotaxis protein
MSIANRITLILVIALASLLVIAGYSLSNAGQAQTRFEYVHINTVPSVKELYDVSQAAQGLRVAVRDYVMSDDAEAASDYEKRINDLSAVIEKGLATYEKDLISNDTDKTLLQADRAAWSTMNTSLQKLLHRSVGDTTPARAMVSPTSDLTRSSLELTKNLSDHMNYNWKLFENLRDDNMAQYARSKWLQIGIFLAVAALLGALGFRLTREIGMRLNRLARFMGEVSTSLDFTSRARIARMDELGRTADAFNKLLDRMQANLKSISDASQSVASSATQMATTSRQVATAAHQQSESASTMAATVEEMTVSVNHVADRATETNRLVTEAGQLSHAGEAVIDKVSSGIHTISATVSEAEEQIRALETHSSRIASVVQVIKEVADQTNLLALNAAIEAARAGEQGRGFAVVADEVRKLAERTSTSTQEINSTVEIMRESARNAVNAMQGVVDRVSDGVASATEANHAIGQIGESSRTAVDMVSEITTAIREQGAATNNIAQQVERIAQMSEESSAAATNTAEVARQLNGLASQMQQIIGAYRLDGINYIH